MQLPNSLANFVDHNYEDSFGTIADSMKAAMFHKAPHMFKALDFENDDNFMEPLFLLKVTYDPVPAFSYEQILFGYINDDKKPDQIRVLSSDKGIIYLPHFGYLKTQALSSELDLFYNRESNTIRLQLNGADVEHTFIPLAIVEGTNIEIQQYNNPLNDDNYGTKDKRQVVDIETGFKDHSEHVRKAMEIIKTYYPWYFSYVAKAVKKIVVFYNDDVRSFASKTTTGISYLSARKEYNEVFFMEDLVHQCAHNILFIMTVQMDEYFAVEAKNGKMSQFNKNEDDQRTIYSAYHGMFSLVNITSLFATVLEKGVFDGHKKHELIGRLADNLRRLGTNIYDVKYRDAFTEKGWSLLLAIEDRYNALLAEYGTFISKYHTTNQPYVFDYSIFLKTNPM